MELAFLIALLFCIALGVYALRVAGQRNRLRDEVALWRFCDYALPPRTKARKRK